MSYRPLRTQRIEEPRTESPGNGESLFKCLNNWAKVCSESAKLSPFGETFELSEPTFAGTQHDLHKLCHVSDSFRAAVPSYAAKDALAYLFHATFSTCK